MYYDYFGFRQPPFRITPDTRLFYPGGERGAVLEALLYAILNGEGIVKVVGEVGSGKTMLCRMLEQELPEHVEVVYLANPSLSPENTLHAIAFELGLEAPPDANRFEIMNSLQEYLLQRHSQNRQVVVFVEEAQAMPLATLEEIRLLSNLETQHNKLLQIVLFGQPELDSMIATPEIRQLKERITYSFRLNPFQAHDIHDYLNSRARACGYRADTLFDRAAVKAIERYSRGLLRRINILADKALLSAYAENTHRIRARHIHQAASDSEFADTHRHWWQRPWPALALLGGLVLLALLGLWLAGLMPQPTPLAGDGAGAPPAQPEDSAGAPEQIPATPPGARAPASAGPGAPEESTVKSEANSEASGAAPASPAATAEAGADTAAPATAPGTQNRPDDQTGAGATTRPDRFYTVLELGGVNEAMFSGTELGALRRQIETLPPESVVSMGPVSADQFCDRCRSLVYRPLKRGENL